MSAHVIELDELTVGGFVMGTGVESSSYIHGLFQHICLQFELVLADGSVVACSKIRASRVSPYTKLSDFTKRFQVESLKENPHQYVEGLLYTKSEDVVMVGDMVDEIGSDGTYNPIGKWYSEWIFKKVEKHLTNRKTHVDYIPLKGLPQAHSQFLLGTTGTEKVSTTRSAEKFVTKHGGFQMLTGDTFTTPEEFRQMFDHTLYDKLRDTLPYCKDAFPEIYGKVNKSVGN